MDESSANCFRKNVGFPGCDTAKLYNKKEDATPEGSLSVRGEKRRRRKYLEERKWMNNKRRKKKKELASKREPKI